MAGGGLIIAGVFLVNSSGGVRRRGAIAVATALLAGLLAGCGGGGSSDAGGCDPVRTEPLDRQYLVHVLPGAPDPAYRTDPPTSGPHQPTPPVEGVVTKPLSRPVQVGLLEEGRVLLQYQGLSSEDRARLEDLAGDMVVVAPNPDLPAGPEVVATAWVTKQTCERLDVDALAEFAEDQVGKGPGSS